MAEVFWHSLEIEEIVKIQNTNLKAGLSQREVEIRKKEFGLNQIKTGKGLTDIEIFLNQFKNFFFLILVFAGVAILFGGERIDAIAIFLVVFLNVLIGFFQERKASKIFECLKKILKTEARIIRNGKEMIVDAIDLVPGDIVVLKAGDKVPADGRIFESQNLRVNEMILTGEFLSSLKHSNPLPEETILADRENMVYMGTVIEEGKGKMIVTETGKNTEIGKISEEIKEIEKKTPLQKKIKNLSIFIAVLVGILVFIVALCGVLRGIDFFLSLETAIALAVSAIPEGLPIAITVILALGAQRILLKGGLIKNLASIETLGSTSIILADKTLTLTEGKMEISEIIGEKERILFGAIITTDAFVENPEDSKENWIIRGRPMEKAILQYALKKGREKDVFNKKKTFDFPFDSQRKFSGAVIKKNDNFSIFLCGAPEKLLSISKNEKEWQERIEEAAKRGFRILGVAEKIVKKFENLEKEIKKQDFNFLGLILFKDPLKKGVKEAILTAKEAGIEPIIVSGDHKLTVKAVMEELGFNIKEDEILEGEKLDKMSDDELMVILSKTKIFARTEPRHKLRVCKAWQKKSRVVAMTGDGVNDAPALKVADIGIAVGSGTEIAKEAADLILLEDNFQVIEEAIKEGRRILDNARKTVLFMCSECFSEIILVLGAFLLKLPLPILPIQILWKNFIEGSPQGLAFAFEPEEKGIMKRGPENPEIPILTREIKYLILFGGFLTDIVLFLFFIVLLNYFSVPIENLRTFCFAALALGSFFYAFSCKNIKENIWRYNPFSNKILNITIFLGFIVLILAIYFPPFQMLIKTSSLGLLEWVFLLIFGSVNLIIFEMVKFFLRKTRKTNQNFIK